MRGAGGVGWDPAWGKGGLDGFGPPPLTTPPGGGGGLTPPHFHPACRHWDTPKRRAAGLSFQSQRSSLSRESVASVSSRDSISSESSDMGE